MKILWTLLAISLIWCILAFSCNSPQTPGNSGPGPDQHTKKGVTVVSPVVVPDAALDAIDEGIAIQISKMPATWAQARRVTDYPVHFVAPEATNQDGSPALIVSGTQSAGTVAGTLCGLNSGGASGTPYLKLPYQTDWQYLDYLRNSVQFESEHLSESKNDCQEFMKWTGPSDRHPHRP